MRRSAEILMIGTRRALLFSGLQRYLVITINLVMMAVVARWLSPKEVGVVLMANGLILLADVLRDFGVSNYLIQALEITKETARTAFTINLILSLFLAGLLYGSSDLIASFYAEPRLVLVLRVVTTTVLFGSLSSPLYALLRRDMAFGTIFVITITATAANFISFCSFIVLGFGYMSLAWASLVFSLINTLLTLALRPYYWIFRPSLQGWRSVVSFGGCSIATDLLRIFYSSLPQLVLGRVLDFSAVGLYSRATMLCQVPERFVISGLVPVLLPALAAQVRGGGSLKASYLRGIGLMTAVQWPSLMCMALLADPIVQLLLGRQWLAVAPLVRIMAMASLAMFPAFLNYPVLVSLGRMKDILITNLVSLPPSGALVFVAAHISLDAVAASMILTGPFEVCVALRFVRRRIFFTWSELFAATRKSAVVALCSALPPAAAMTLSGFRSDMSLPLMFVTGAAAALGWLAGLWITRHPLLAEEMRIAMQQIAPAVRSVLGHVPATVPQRAAANSPRAVDEPPG
jgi:O-antigen/teichoic acid export membrane protein